MPETSQERLQRLQDEMEQRARLFKKLIEKLGPEVLEVAKQHVIDTTQAQYEHMDLPQRDLDAVLALIWEPAGDDLDYTVEERTPNRLKLRVTRCMWADEMRKHDAGDIGFAFHCCWDYGFCQGLNPAMRFTRTKTLMQGDDCCDHTYEV